MPKLYTSQSVFSGTVGNRADATDFGSGLGESITQLGNVMRVAENNKTAIDVDARHKQFQRDWSEKYVDLYNNAPADGEGFVDLYEGEFDTFSQGYFEGLSPKGVAALKKKIDGDKTDYYLKAVTHQTSLSIKNTKHNFNLGNEARKNNVANDPANYPQEVIDAEELIDALELPPTIKEELRTQSKNELAFAHGQSVLRQRPGQSYDELVDQASAFRDELLGGAWDEILTEANKKTLLDDADKVINTNKAAYSTESSNWLKNYRSAVSNGDIKVDDFISEEELSERAYAAAKGNPAEANRIIKGVQADHGASIIFENYRYAPQSDDVSLIQGLLADLDKVPIENYDDFKGALNSLIGKIQTKHKAYEEDRVQYLQNHPQLTEIRGMVEDGTATKEQESAILHALQQQMGTHPADIRLFSNADKKRVSELFMDAETINDGIMLLESMPEMYGQYYEQAAGEITAALPSYARTATIAGIGSKAAGILLNGHKNGQTLEDYKKRAETNGLDKARFAAANIIPDDDGRAKAYERVGAVSQWNELMEDVEYIAYHLHFSTGARPKEAIDTAYNLVFNNYDTYEVRDSSVLIPKSSRGVAVDTDAVKFGIDQAIKELPFREDLFINPSAFNMTDDRAADLVFNAHDAAIPVQSPDENGIAFKIRDKNGIDEYVMQSVTNPDGSKSSRILTIGFDELQDKLFFRSDIRDKPTYQDVRQAGGIAAENFADILSLGPKAIEFLGERWMKGVGGNAKDVMDYVSSIGEGGLVAELKKAAESERNPQPVSSSTKKPVLAPEPTEKQPESIKGIDPQSYNSSKIYEKIKNDEGLRFTPYQLVRQDGTKENFYTAGHGHRMSSDDLLMYPPGSTIPEWQVKKWFNEDMKKATDAAFSQVKNLPTDNPKAVDMLIAMNFQLGAGWTAKFPRAWSLMQAGEFKKASVEIATNDAGDGPSAWYNQSRNRVEDAQAILRVL